MENQFENLGYKISTNPDLLDKITGMTPELREQMEMLQNKAKKGGKKNIDFLNQKINEYPNIPQLKDLLSEAYMQSDNEEKSYEINDWILEEHPDYLFGFLYKADEYFFKEEYHKIPELLGETMEIRELFPNRDEFHIIEVVSFLERAIMYFSALNDIEAAESRYKILEKMAPDFKETEIAYGFLLVARLRNDLDGPTEEGKPQIIPRLSGYNKSVQTNKAPEFKNPVINKLYEYDFEIPHDILKEILELPLDSVITDLKKVLWDSICRYEYFNSLIENDQIDDTRLMFPMHAIFLLGELKAEEALEDILETFRQGQDFIEFWYTGIFVDYMWEALYKIAENNLEKLKNFMLEPGVFSIPKSEVSTAIKQYYFHNPESREQILQWYENIFNHFLRTEQENLIDSELIGLLISDVMDADFKELLPVIEKLFESGYVEINICGTLDEVHEHFRNQDIPNWKEDVLNIYETYENLSDGWNFDEELDNELFDPFMEEDTPEVLPVRNEPKIGRNDPCPCGSGKKYKKCCWNK